MSEPGRRSLRFARYRAPRRACGGAVAIEFALVFLIFFLLFYAIVAYGFVLAIEQSLTMAAEEGARSAVQYAPDDTTRLARSKAMAEGLLTWMPAGGVTVTASPVSCPPGSVATGTGTYCIQVVVNYNYKTHPIVPSLPSLGITIPDTLEARATIQYVQF